MVDSSGALYIHGGIGYGFNFSSGANFLKDLWIFNIGNRKWRWISGSSGIVEAGRFGAIGVSSINYNPSAGYIISGLSTFNGSLWTYEGRGVTNSGFSNLIRRFRPDLCPNGYYASNVSFCLHSA